jgi:hypothetical protein
MRRVCSLSTRFLIHLKRGARGFFPVAAGLD